MKKKIIVIIIVIILGIGAGTSIYLLLPKKNKLEEKKLNINSTLVINSLDVTGGDDFYIVKNTNGFTTYDLSQNKLYTYEDTYTDYSIYNNYIIITTNDNIIVIDKIGKEIITGNYLTSIYNNTKYLILDNKVYNSNMEEVYTLPDYFNKEAYINNTLYLCQIINDNLIMSFEDKEYNKIINLITKEEVYTNFDEYIIDEIETNDSKYIFIKVNDKYNIYDTIKNEIVIKDINIDPNLVIYKDNDTMYIYNNKIYKNNTKINNKYYMDTTNCEVGGKLLDNKDNIIIDKCMLYYEELFSNVIMGTNNKESILYINNKILSANSFTKEGEYIVAYTYNDTDSTSKIYNKKGEYIKTGNSTYYINNNLYREYNTTNQTFYFTNNKLDKISNEFDYIDCPYNNYCNVSDTNYNKTIYHNGKKITNNNYDEIIINKNYIVATTAINTYIYILGTNPEINIDKKEEININTNEIIDKYELKSIENKINENIDLFNKYAYIVENNNNLLDYKKQVMDIFEVIIDNKEYLNEINLLKKLRKLNIVYTDNLDPGVAATYEDASTRINLGEHNVATLYHELVHFIDFSINNNNYRYSIYKCNNKYIIQKNYSSECEIISIDSNFITESGAELYSGKYFNKEIDSYYPAPLILESLEYIYGKDEINKWFFESDSYFKKIWLDIGYSYEDTKKVIESLTKRTKIGYYNDDDTIFLVDAIIDLYKYRNSNEFLKDNKFTYILRSLIENKTDFSNSKYSNELKIISSNSSSIKKLFKDTFPNYYFYNDFGNFIIIDNKPYLTFTAYHNGETKILLVDYDFDNNNIIDYTEIDK